MPALRNVIAVTSYVANWAFRASSGGPSEPRQTLVYCCPVKTNYKTDIESSRSQFSPGKRDLMHIHELLRVIAIAFSGSISHFTTMNDRLRLEETTNPQLLLLNIIF